MQLCALSCGSFKLLPAAAPSGFARRTATPPPLPAGMARGGARKHDGGDGATEREK